MPSLHRDSNYYDVDGEEIVARISSICWVTEIDFHHLVQDEMWKCGIVSADLKYVPCL